MNKWSIHDTWFRMVWWCGHSLEFRYRDVSPSFNLHTGEWHYDLQALDMTQVATNELTWWSTSCLLPTPSPLPAARTPTIPYDNDNDNGDTKSNDLQIIGTGGSATRVTTPHCDTVHVIMTSNVLQRYEHRIYDGSSNEWYYMAPPLTQRIGCAAVAARHHMYLCGGLSTHVGFVATVV